MTLTKEERLQIMDLYGKDYSSSKITNITYHSSSTISGVVKKAKEEVLDLIHQGISIKEIVNQTQIPLDFVKKIAKEPRPIPDEQLQSQNEGVSASTVDSEPRPTGIQNQWQQFQRQQELDSQKKELQEEANGDLNTLQEMRADYAKYEILDEQYEERDSKIISQLEDFVIPAIASADASSSLKPLEKILTDIHDDILDLASQYDTKVEEKDKALEQEKKLTSDRLLDSEIDIPLYPDFLKLFIKRKFPVHNKQEATTIMDAMFEYWLTTNPGANKTKKETDRDWRVFIKTVRVRGWEQLNKLAANYRRRPIPSNS